MVFGPHAFELFRRAGHDGDRADFGRIVAQFLGAVGLGQGAHHADGRFARGEVGQKFRIEGLGVFLPPRATGRKLRQGLVDFFRQPGQQFRPLFPDGHIGGELVVPDIGEAELMERRQHLVRGHASHGHAERIAQGVAHGRGRHGDHFDVLVLQFGFDLRNEGHGFVDGRDRAVGQTLAAVDAHGRIDDLMGFAGLAGNGTGRAVAEARVAADAFGFVDLDDQGMVQIRAGLRHVGFVEDFRHLDAAHTHPPTVTGCPDGPVLGLVRLGDDKIISSF